MQDLSRATVAMETKKKTDDSSCLQIASCGLDHSVRIFNVTVSARLVVLLSRKTALKLLYETAPSMWWPLRGRCGSCTRNEVSLFFCWMTAQPFSNQWNRKKTTKIHNLFFV